MSHTDIYAQYPSRAMLLGSGICVQRSNCFRQYGTGTSWELSPINGI